ncbi:MAG: TolC family protein [Flavobacteriales bacterium]|nr:TolC family protein [Flavobacteriales bacterium]MBT7620167.1 TolC family protein [Flavobacteriales bacterium]
MKKIIIILFLISPSILFSQESLSLENAIRIGLKQNFDIQLSEKNLEISKVKNNLANAGALPTINISAKNERSVSDQSNNPTSFIQETLKAESMSATANMSWTLFNGYGIKANKKKLSQIEQLSNGNLTLTIENTTQGILLSYYNCVIQKERLELLQKVVNLSRERLIYQKTKYEIGSSSKLELLQTENSLLTDSSNLILQKLNYDNSVKNLNLILGVELNKKWNLTDKINDRSQLFNFENLKNQTLSDNTNLRNQHINMEIIKQDIILSKSIYRPMVSFNSGGSYNTNTYDIGDSGYEGDNTGKTLNYYANLTVSLRLYDGGKYKNTKKENKIKEEINELELKKIRREVLQQLSINYQKYNSNITIHNLNKKAFKIAETNYLLANDKNNRGVINSFTLRDIEIAYLNSGISYLQSAYNLNESYLELMKITGGILQEETF